MITRVWDTRPVPASRRAAGGVAMLCLGLLTAGTARAVDAQVWVGFTTGVTWAGMSGSFLDGSGRELGAVLGVSAEYQIARWVLDAEVTFTQKGGNGLTLPTTTDPVDLKYTYIEIPVMLHRVIPVGPWSLHPFVGGTVGFNTGCGYRVPGGQSFDPCGAVTPAGSATSRDAGLTLGFAMRHRYDGGAWISLETRASGSIRTASLAAEVAGQTARNNVLAFVFAFGLPLGGSVP